MDHPNFVHTLDSVYTLTVQKCYRTATLTISVSLVMMIRPGDSVKTWSTSMSKAIFSSESYTDKYKDKFTALGLMRYNYHYQDFQTEDFS